MYLSQEAANIDPAVTQTGQGLQIAREEAASLIADPNGPCPDCGNRQFWQLPDEHWHCRVCEPDIPLIAISITLCHKQETKPVQPYARLWSMLQTA